MAENEIILYGSVGGSLFWDEEAFTAGDVRAMLDGRSGPLTVRINSGGGIASEGQAIYTMLRDYAHTKGTVQTVCDAVAMSAASLIYMAGDVRTMRLGSYLLIHDPASFFTEGRGTESDHRRAADQLRIVSEAYAEVYAERAGITRAEARRIMQDETVMDGETAVLMDFATEKEAAEALIAAKFDYRIYAHAPERLREASRSLGAPQGKQAVMAVMAGLPRPTQKEALMADKDKPAGGTAVDDTTKPDPKAPEPQKAPNGAPLPERTVDPGAEPEKPQTVEVARQERARIMRIQQAATMSGVSMTLANKLVEDGTPLEAALDKINEAWAAAGDKDIAMHGQSTSRVTGDSRDRFSMGVSKALMAKVGLKGGERNEFTSMSLKEIARASLEMRGVRIGGMDVREMVGAALRMSGDAPGYHTTGDFVNVLGDIARKSILRGWTEAEENYAFLTGDPIPLTDFRPSTAVDLGVFDNLAEKPEGAEYKYGTFGDRKMTISLLTYGRLFAITREAIINDDLGILGRVPVKMGRAARRTVGNLVWGVLTANPTLDDGFALFSTQHANLATGAGSALSMTSLQAALSAMALQKADGVIIGMRPRYLVVPQALEFTAREIVESNVYPGANRGMQANPLYRRVEVVVDPRLDAISTTAWYLTADPATHEVIMLATLNGETEPFLDEKDNWSADGHEWKVRMDAGVSPGDYRAVYKANGA